MEGVKGSYCIFWVRELLIQLINCINQCYNHFMDKIRADFVKEIVAVD